MKEKDVRKIGKTMDKSKAKKWVKKYQKENPNSTHGWLFGDDVIEKLVRYEGCEGIWFFKAINDEGEEKLVMFPADADGNILDRKMKSLGAAVSLRDPGDDPADFSETCPPKCPEGI